MHGISERPRRRLPSRCG